MEKVFASPMTYRQGPNVLWQNLASITAFGSKGLIVTDDFVYRLVGERLTKELLSLGNEMDVWLVSEGVLTKSDADYVIALGGGKAIDLGKKFAFENQKYCIVVPTSAATDAPTSRISVMYQNGHFKKYVYYQRSPELILVDTAILINSPTNFLIAGIADGLSTFIEARTVRENEGINTLGATPTLAAQAIAEKCRDVLFEYSEAGIEAHRKKEITPAFEAVIEANILLSGIGFESGGLSIAHALHNAMVSLWGTDIKGSHGEIIALTTLQHLQLEKRETEHIRYRRLFEKLGLPTSYEALSIFPTPAELQLIAEKALSSEDGIVRSRIELDQEAIFHVLRNY